MRDCIQTQVWQGMQEGSGLAEKACRSGRFLDSGTQHSSTTLGTLYCPGPAIARWTCSFSSCRAAGAVRSRVAPKPIPPCL